MIRQATVEDLPKLETCAREFYASSRFLKEFSLFRFCEMWTTLLHNGGVIFIALESEEITGVMGGFIHRDLYSESMVAEEMFWFVRSAFRGVGIRLYRAFEAWAQAAGATTIQMVHLLDSMPEKISAFYRRIGFEPIETRYSKRLA